MDRERKHTEVIEIFTIPILSTKLDLDNESILSYCLNERSNHDGRVCSNLSGWQSNDLDFQKISNELKKLFKLVEEYSLEFSKYVETKQSYKIDNAWININGYKDSNLKHSHPHSLFSASYYVKVPKNSGEIVFENPAANVIQYDWSSPLRYNKYTSAVMRFTVTEGLLLLFPSWLNHYVLPNNNHKEERVSIALNIK